MCKNLLTALLGTCMGKIVAQLMWNGVWKYVNKKFCYEPQENFSSKTLVLRSEDQTPTLENLKRIIAPRMKLSMEFVPSLKLWHMRRGMEMYPATLIDDDAEVELLFDTYEPTETIHMYAEYDRGYLIPMGRRNVEKLVPRRNRLVMPSPNDVTPDIAEIEVPRWEGGFNEDFLVVGTGGGLGDVGTSSGGPCDAGTSGGGRQIMAICNEPDSTDHGEGFPHGMSSGEEQDSLQGDDVHSDDAMSTDHGEGFPPGMSSGEEPASNPVNTSQAWGTQLQRHPTMELEDGTQADSTRTDGTDLEKGYIFDDPKTFKNILLDAATKHGWAWGRAKKDRTRISMHCRDLRCKWYVGAYKNANDRYYTLSRYNNIHTCSTATTNFKHSNVKVEDVAFSMLDE